MLTLWNQTPAGINLIICIWFKETGRGWGDSLIVWRLKVKLLDHVFAGCSGIGRRAHLPFFVWSVKGGRKQSVYTNVAIGLVQYGKCVNNVSGVNALGRPRPKKRSCSKPLTLGYKAKSYDAMQAHKSCTRVHVRLPSGGGDRTHKCV